jgi:nucleotide-binding universal stress UspA family protein/nitrite reductase/ring-hydroxylating ferredoxin subunit
VEGEGAIACGTQEVLSLAYKRILFGTDGTARAAASSHVAAELAMASKAELIIAHVWERPEGAQAVLDAAVTAAQEAGVKKVKAELHGGRSPADVLVDLAEERDVGLVVVSGGRSKTEIGPTAGRLSHRAPRDLLIAMDVERGDGRRLYRRVLIATDGSATADRAARKGFDLAESVGAPVTMVFVGHPATGTLVTDDTVAVYGGDVECDVVLRQGDPAREILAVARETGADLVVIGNKGMTGAKRFFLNLVPEKVVDLTDRDVLVARTIAQVASELEPGDGGILVQAGERLAAFMDDAGELHLMSARCTHMGCTVAWSAADHLFECPCHGSRFGPGGEVVNGPAARPLPPA